MESFEASVVTISAPFGAGGGIIAPAVAERLGVPFVDRAIPVSVAWSLAVPVDEALAHDEHADTFLDRLVNTFAMCGIPWAAGVASGLPLDAQSFRAETERVIHEAADQPEGCVILGRAAAIVLREHPRALFVRLEGSFERRVLVAMEHSSDSEAELRRFLEESDRNRQAYFRQLYRADPNDARLFHLVIDSTVLGFETAVELIVSAARARTKAT